MAGEVILKNDGDMEDISGHESMSRESPNQLVVHMCDYHWVIESTAPITVTAKEGYPQSDDDDEDEEDTGE